MEKGLARLKSQISIEYSATFSIGYVDHRLCLIPRGAFLSVRIGESYRFSRAKLRKPCRDFMFSTQHTHHKNRSIRDTCRYFNVGTVLCPLSGTIEETRWSLTVRNIYRSVQVIFHFYELIQRCC